MNATAPLHNYGETHPSSRATMYPKIRTRRRSSIESIKMRKACANIGRIDRRSWAILDGLWREAPDMGAIGRSGAPIDIDPGTAAIVWSALPDDDAPGDWNCGRKRDCTWVGDPRTLPVIAASSHSKARAMRSCRVHDRRRVSPENVCGYALSEG